VNHDAAQTARFFEVSAWLHVDLKEHPSAKRITENFNALKSDAEARQ